MKQYVKTNYVFEPFKMAKTTANNPNGNVQCKLQGRMAERSKAPDSRIFSLEISGTRLCARVAIPLLSDIFKNCEVSHELKAMQNQKFFAFESRAV